MKKHLLFILFLAISFLISQLYFERGPIYDGDAVEYLIMTKRIDGGQMPESSLWTPGYSFLIYLIKAIFNVNYLGAVKIVNTCLLLILYTITYQLFIKHLSIVKKIIAIFFLISLRYIFFYHALISAEMSFITTMFLLMYVNIKIDLYKDTKVKLKHLLASPLLIILCLSMKYTALSLIPVIIISIGFFTKYAMKEKALLIAINIILPFLAHYFYVQSFSSPFDPINHALSVKSEYIKNYFEYNVPYFIQFHIMYYLIPKIGSFMYLIVLNPYSIICYVLILFIVTYLLYNAYKLKDYKSSFLQLFILFYTLLIIHRSSTTGFNEINDRTLLFVFFSECVLLIHYLTLKNKAAIIFISAVLIFFSINGFLMQFQTIKRIKYEGYGMFSKGFQQTLDFKAIEILRSQLKEKPNMVVYSNTTRPYSFYLGNIRVNELSLDPIPYGNVFVTPDKNKVQSQLFKLKEEIKEGKGICVISKSSYIDSLFWEKNLKKVSTDKSIIIY